MKTVSKRISILLLNASLLLSSIVCQTMPVISRESEDIEKKTDQEMSLPERIIQEVLPKKTDSYIAFVKGNSIDAQSVRQGLYLVRSDGTGMIDLGGPFTWNDSPCWSPDGTKLAFWSEIDGNRDIYLLDLSSHKTARLTDSPGWDIHPNWAPDGSKIAFVSDRNGVLDIFTMNPDGSDQKPLLSSKYNKTYPTWSPDGKRLALLEEIGWNGLKVVNIDGGEELAIGAAKGRPAWSPDGKMIAFSGISNNIYRLPQLSENVPFKQGNNPEIIIFNFETKAYVFLTDNPGVDAFPTWSADGKYLVYESDRDDQVHYTRSLYQIEFSNNSGNLEVRQETRLVSDIGSMPAWSPVALEDISAPPIIQPAPPPYVNVCPSGCDFDSIQKAIDSANGMLNIQVNSGVYSDPLVIDKPVWLYGQDTGSGQPVIDIPLKDRAVQITAPNVILKGFHFVSNVTSSQIYSLIYVTSDFNTISGNTFSCEQYVNPRGIRLELADYTMVRDNNFGYCGDIYIGAGSYNQVIENETPSLSSFMGISVSSNYLDEKESLPLHRTTSMFNAVLDNATSSILIDHHSHENRVANNSVFVPQDNAAYGRMGENELRFRGVILINCNPALNLVGSNQLIPNGGGIRLTTSGMYNMILNNQISGGSNGISMERSCAALVFGNRVADSSHYGIYNGTSLEVEPSQAAYVGTCGWHLIYNNVLLNNEINAYDGAIDVQSASMASRWDNGVIGNYYSDYDESSEGCSDNNGDNICDSPHQIPGEQESVDHLPSLVEFVE